MKITLFCKFLLTTTENTVPGIGINGMFQAERKSITTGCNEKKKDS